MSRYSSVSTTSRKPERISSRPTRQVDVAPARISSRPTRSINVVQSPIHDSVVAFFSTFGSGPFELDTVVHFVLRVMSITPDNYTVIHAGIRDYILANFTITAGRYKQRQDVHLRSVMVSHKV